MGKTKIVARAAAKSMLITPNKGEVGTQQKTDDHNENREKRVADKNNNDAPVIIYEPRSADVICGRGKEAFEHIGNDCFRLLIARYADTYQEAPTKKAKSQSILKIVDIVNARGGRFLMRRNSIMTTTTNTNDVAATNDKPIKTTSSNVRGVNDNSKNNKNNEDKEGWIDGGIKMGKKKTGYALRDAVRGRVKCIFEKAPSTKEIQEPYDYNHHERIFRPLKVEDNNSSVQTYYNTNTLWRPQHQRMISYDEGESNKSPFKKRRDNNNSNYYRSPESLNNKYSHQNHQHHYGGESPFMMGRGNYHQYQPHHYQHPNDEMGSTRISTVPDKHKSNILQGMNLKRKITPSKTEDEPEKDWRNFKELDNEVANGLITFFSDDGDDNKSSNCSSSARNEDYHNNEEDTNQLSDNNNNKNHNSFKNEAKQDNQHDVDDRKSNNINVVKDKEVKSNNINISSSSSSHDRNDNGENYCCDRITITPPPYQHHFYPNNDISPYKHHHHYNYLPAKNKQQIYQPG